VAQPIEEGVGTQPDSREPVSKKDIDGKQGHCVINYHPNAYCKENRMIGHETEEKYMLQLSSSMPWKGVTRCRNDRRDVL